MPEPRRSLNEDLDDDDDDGSKGEEEEVVAFDEQRDLPPLQNSKKQSPARPTAGPTQTAGYNPAAPRTVERRKATGSSTNVGEDNLDAPEVLAHVASVTVIPWPPAAGKRPPRDMKRLVQGEWYIVCKVMKWGDTPALFVRASKDFNNDYGFYKPPAQYYSYLFQVGDRIQLSQVGYSSSRNKVATEIRVKATHMFAVPESKINWVAPAIVDVVPSNDVKPSKKKSHAYKDDDDDYAVTTAPVPSSSSAHKKKKHQHQQYQQELPPITSARISHDFSHHGLPFSPLGLTAMQQHQQAQQHHQAHHQHKKDKMMFQHQMFQHQPSFAPGTGGLSQPQLMSGGNLFAFPSTPDLGLARGQSFSFMSDLLATGSSANLMAPQSPVLGGASPMMGAPQASMHRIPSIGGSISGPLGSFSINSPTTHMALSYGFPSQANFGAATDQGNGML